MNDVHMGMGKVDSKMRCSEMQMRNNGANHGVHGNFYFKMVLQNNAYVYCQQIEQKNNVIKTMLHGENIGTLPIKSPEVV